MAKTAWPTVQQVTDRLTGLGVTSIPTGVSIQDYIDEAVAVLEQMSGISPFLGEAISGSISYDPSYSGWIDLRTRWLEIDSVEINGDVLVEGEDYWLRPYNGPYTVIDFRNRYIGDPYTVVVTGKRGYGGSIPIDLWNAVLDYAAGKVFGTSASVGSVTSGAVSEIRQADVTLKYAGGSGSSSLSTSDSLINGALATFARYQSLRVGTNP